MRLDAERLEPDIREPLSHISYAEPIALCVVGIGLTMAMSARSHRNLACASTQRRIPFPHMVAHVTGHPVWHHEDTHFRPALAHTEFVRR